MFTTNRSRILFAAWWLLWSTLHAWIIHSAGFTWQLAWTDSAVSNLKLVALCFALSYTLRYYRPNEMRSLYLIPWVIALAAIWLWVVKKGIAWFVKDDPAYLEFLSNTLVVRYCIGVLLTGCFVLLYWVWYYISTRQEDENRRMSIEKLARETELYTLRQQLQPHFLFNTLNSISALVGSKPAEAKRMVQQLSDFLRGTLKKDDRQSVSFADELQHLQLYLDIEKVRFGHRLKTEVQADEQCTYLMLPSLLLQPIVENAVKFGLYDTTEEVTIRITARKEDHYLVISVENPFDPLTAKPRQGTGFGLQSVNRRLYLLFARTDLLQTQTRDDQFIATVRIPQNT